MTSTAEGVPLLVFDQVTLGYPGTRTLPVLNDFSLTVDAHTFVSVVGPSGCGKSTLLHATAGFIPPLSGSIRLLGQPIEAPGLDIGFVSQRYALFPWLTVEENVAFGLRSQQRPDSDIKEIVSGLLQTVGLDGRRSYYPEQLSGGMQQRVALARAMAPHPRLLLLDEPFSALDTQTRRRMHELLLQLWRQHSTTILFVTHDIQEALVLADRLVMLTTMQGEAKTLDVPFARPRTQETMASDVFRHLETIIASQFRRSTRAAGEPTES